MPTQSPSSTPSVSVAPSSTPSVFCPEGITAKVEIVTDLFSGETSWDIYKDADVAVVAARNSFEL